MSCEVKVLSVIEDLPEVQEQFGLSAGMCLLVAVLSSTSVISLLFHANCR